MSHKPLIVVGVDGSPASVDALRWAAKQSELTGNRLEAVTTWQFPTEYEEIFFDDKTDTWSEPAARRLDEAVAEAGLNERDLDKTVVNGHPVPVLVGRCADAELLVVGSRGRGGFRGLLLGSVSSSVLQHAACPVVVIRHHDPAGRPGGDAGAPA